MMQREASIDQSLRAALDAGLNELSDGGGMEGIGEVDFDSLGLDLDVSLLKDLETDVVVDATRQDGGEDAGAGASAGMVLQGGEPLDRQLSYSIGGDMMLSRQGSTIGGDPLAHQSSFDISTMIQVSVPRCRVPRCPKESPVASEHAPCVD